MSRHISQTANLVLCKSTTACIKRYKSFKQIIKWITYITQLMILYLITRCCYHLLNIAGGYLWATTDVFVWFIIPVIGFVQLYKISFSVSNDPICSISESWHTNAKMNQICKHLPWCYIHLGSFPNHRSVEVIIQKAENAKILLEFHVSESFKRNLIHFNLLIKDVLLLIVLGDKIFCLF